MPNYCEWCKTKLGELACSNRYGGSFCSAKCADSDEVQVNAMKELAIMKREEELQHERFVKYIQGGHWNETAAVPDPTPYSVTHPEHYHSHEIDPIEYMKQGFPKELYAHFCVGNIIKYVSRFDKKNGMEDLEKARDYINRLIDWRAEKW